MKRLLTLLIIFPFISLAQNISNVKAFSEAIALSKTYSKPTLLIIEFPLENNAYINAKNVIRNPQLVKLMNENFIVFETTIHDPSIKHLVSKYNINTYPTFLFINESGEPFMQETGFSPIIDQYISMINQAIKKKDEKPLSILEKEYRAEPNNNLVLKQLISTRKSLNIVDNAALIEKYVATLPPEDLKSYETVLFILEAGPYADGEAFKIAFSDKKLVQKIYQTSTAGAFSKIRSRITDNTLKNAIKTKNIEQAKAVANYLKDLAGPVYGHKNYSSTLIGYYKGVGDTANFLNNAVDFYDVNFMSLSDEDIAKRQQSYLHSEILKTLPFSTPTITKTKKDSIEIAAVGIPKKTISTSIVAVNSGNFYASTLNNIAWDFYKTGTKDNHYLTKAMNWSRRSIELQPSANYYDTLAHILYRLSYVDQAIKMQELAISQAKTQKVPFANMQEELKKMIDKTL